MSGKTCKGEENTDVQKKKERGHRLSEVTESSKSVCVCVCLCLCVRVEAR